MFSTERRIGEYWRGVLTLPPNMDRKPCPRCGYPRHWNLRRGRLKCKRCRLEFSPGTAVVRGSRMDAGELRASALAFVALRTVRGVAAATGTSAMTAQKACHRFRLAIAAEERTPFAGPVEVDETYVGAQRKNQRLHIRKLYPPKRGHGTNKLPVIGACDRATGTVRVEVMARKLDKGVVLGFVSRSAVPGTRVFTDGFPYYRDLARLGFAHEWVDHNAGEYVRGDVHTNGIEGFWGFMKRRMGCIGGMRRDRLGLFATELAWRYNRRHLSDDEKADLLVGLVIKFGGRI